MRKFIATGFAALTVVGALAAAASPAAAQGRWDGRYRDRGRNNDASTAIVAGIAGLAIGTALAGSNNSRPAYGYGDYDGYAPPPPPPRPGYGYGAPGPAYGYGGYGVCQQRQRVYDPYLGRSVVVTQRYAC